MNKLNKLAISALACTVFLTPSFPLSPSANSALANPNEIRQYTIATKTGQPEMNLRFMPRDVVRIDSDFKFNRKAPQKRFNGYLLKIDDKIIKGKNRTQIRDLINGPVHSMIKLTYLDSDFKPQEIIMRRVQPEMRAKPPDSSLVYIKDFSRFLAMDSSVCHVTDFFQFSRDLVKDDLDMLAKISVLSSMRAVNNILPPNDALLCYHAADAVMLLDSIGDMDGADKYLAMVVKNPKFTKRRQESQFRRQFLEHLLSTGRGEEFKTISAVLEKELDRDDIDTHSDGLNRWSFSRLQLEYLLPRDKEKATKLALDMEKAKDLSWGERNYLDSEWLGDTLEGLGLTKNALDCYRKLEPQKQLERMLGQNRNIRITSAYGYQALRIAQLEDKVGDTGAAVATLESLLKTHDKYLKHEDEVLIEQLPIYFPARSDLESQLALYYFKQKEYDKATELVRSINKRLDEAKVASAQSKILNALLDADAQSKAEEIAEMRLSMPDLVDEKYNYEIYRLVRRALGAVAAGDYADADNAVESLKKVYLDFVPENIYKNPPANMFCALLNISRKLADKGEYTRSNKILSFLESSLDKEAQPKAFTFILAEQTLNAVDETGDNTKWELLNRENPLKLSSNLDFLPKRVKQKKPAITLATKMENARLFGQVYCAAGDLKRSQKFIDHALELAGKLGDESYIESQKKKTLLFLDAAILYSKMQEAKEAEKYFSKALKLREAISLVKAEAQKDNIPDGGFAGACNYKSAEFAGCLASMSETQKAIKLLKEVEPFFKKDKVAENFNPGDVVTRSKVHQTLAGHAAVKSQLANLLFQSKDFKEANEYIASAAYDIRNDGAPLFFWSLASKIAVAAGDNAAAAHYFSEAEKTIDYPIRVDETQPGYHEMLFDNACKYADDAQELGDNEKANIFLRAGLFYKEKKPERTWELYKKAYKYVSDFEPKKAELSKQIAELDKQIAAIREEKGPKEGKKSDGATGENRLADLKRAAKLAEKNKRSDGYSFWIALATEQANQNLCEDAEKSAYHGLSLYKKHSESLIGVVPVSYNGAPSALADKGKVKEAEKLLKDSVDIVDSVDSVNTKHSEQSYKVAKQLVQLYVFYVETNQQQLALNTLDQILKFKQRELEAMGFSSGLQTILSYARIPSNCKDNKFFRTTLMRLLEAQKKQLPANDIRIANTLIALAEVEKKLALYKEADDRLQKATEIKTLFLGKDKAEAEIFRYRKVCLEKLGKTDELKRLEQLTKSGRYYHRKRKQPGKDLTFIQRLQFNLKEEREFAPYSPDTADCLGGLARYWEKEKDWKAVLDAMKERIDIYERSEDKYAGRLGGCTRPTFYRYEYYTMAAKAEFNLNKEGRAGDAAAGGSDSADGDAAAGGDRSAGGDGDGSKWIKRAVEIVPLLASHELLELSSTAAEIGNKELATELARASEEAMMNSRDSWNYQKLSEVWKNIGNSKRAREFEKKSILSRKRRHMQRSQMEKSPFDGFSP